LASPQAHSHILAQERLRTVVSRAVERLWTGLPGYDAINVPQWLGGVVPLVLAGQFQSAALTQAFVTQRLGRPVSALPAVGADVRNGTDPDEVYRRPFVQLWAALKEGVQWQDAVDGAGARAVSSAEMDMQLASRGTFGRLQQADDGIFGYIRVADGGACQFCAEIDGAYVKDGDAMPLHNRCGCSLEPLTAPHPRAATLPSGVAVHQHGELGAVLTDPSHDFTTQAEAFH
jgi:hypothetical protein